MRQLRPCDRQGRSVYFDQLVPLLLIDFPVREPDDRRRIFQRGPERPDLAGAEPDQLDSDVVVPDERLCNEKVYGGGYELGRWRPARIRRYPIAAIALRIGVRCQADPAGGGEAFGVRETIVP